VSAVRLPVVVARLVALGCMVPALAVGLAVLMWKDRAAPATLGATAFLLVSVVVGAVLAQRLYRPPGRAAPTEM
jgi:hypothetical protein